MERNIMLETDAYKVSHYRQYPEGTSHVYSYFESRGGKWPECCFFGLQFIIKSYFRGVVVTENLIREAKEYYADLFGDETIFNEQGWRYILEEHGGRLPIRIKSVPEGTVVPVHNVLFTVENLDPKLAWLTNWLETLLVQVWYPMTVCTNSREQKKLLGRFLGETADSLDSLPFMLHDFGYRGSTSNTSAGIGGAAHLVNFVGTDTMAAVRVCRQFYHCHSPAASIPAAEHSTITAWTEEGEAQAFANMDAQFPLGAVSVVVDSYDTERAVGQIWGERLHPLVMARKQRGGRIVLRPDSGDPKQMVLKVLTLLGEKFATETNGRGYRMLPTQLRVIQGDGVCYEKIDEVLTAIREAGWSADNVVFGSGGALLQKLDRDTLKCALKCSSATVGGVERDVFKDPVTDPGKRSKKGRLTLQRDPAKGYVTVEQGRGDTQLDQLVTVFENGELLKDWTLAEIRANAEIDAVKQWLKRETTV